MGSVDAHRSARRKQKNGAYFDPGEIAKYPRQEKIKKLAENRRCFDPAGATFELRGACKACKVGHPNAPARRAGARHLARMHTDSTPRPDRLDWQNSKRPSKITVPANANPLAKLVFAEMQKQGVTYAELEHRSGVLISTFKAWRTDNAPGLATIEAALGALGWALVPVPRMERIPERIRDALDAINAEWAGEEPLLHHLLASACLAPIMVEGPGEAAE